MDLATNRSTATETLQAFGYAIARGLSPVSRQEFLAAGQNTKPGEEMSPREQMIVDMKKELAAKLLKSPNTGF